MCLKVVSAMLKRCNYEGRHRIELVLPQILHKSCTLPTCACVSFTHCPSIPLCAVITQSNGHDALEMLRQRQEDGIDQFDLILSDVYMPDMDGFRLLELIALELELPVIMMSSDGDTNVVLRGVTHGAVDFLIKPVRIEELRNVWQHVIRRRSVQISRGEDSAVDYDGDSRTHGTKRKDTDTLRAEHESASGNKKQRVVWSVEMHQQFVNAVNILGLEKAVPKRILDLMNVEGLTRENVASHLQKYRLYLKRVEGVQSGRGGRIPKPPVVERLVAESVECSQQYSHQHQQQQQSGGGYDGYGGNGGVSTHSHSMMAGMSGPMGAAHMAAAWQHQQQQQQHQSMAALHEHAALSSGMPGATMAHPYLHPTAAAAAAAAAMMPSAVAAGYSSGSGLHQQQPHHQHHHHHHHHHATPMTITTTPAPPPTAAAAVPPPPSISLSAGGMALGALYTTTTTTTSHIPLQQPQSTPLNNHNNNNMTVAYHHNVPGSQTSLASLPYQTPGAAAAAAAPLLTTGGGADTTTNNGDGSGVATNTATGFPPATVDASSNGRGGGGGGSVIDVNVDVDLDVDLVCPSPSPTSAGGHGHTGGVFAGVSADDMVDAGGMHVQQYQSGDEDALLPTLGAGSAMPEEASLSESLLHGLPPMKHDQGDQEFFNVFNVQRGEGGSRVLD